MRHLIIGGGIAGVALAKRFLERGEDFLLLDRGQNYSSRIAAGMINPLVFRRMTKSWRVDEFMPAVREYYSSWEVLTGTTFFHTIPIRRFFSSDQERQFWLDRQHTPEFSPYMQPTTEKDEAIYPAINPFGSGVVKQSCYVDTHGFLDAAHAYLQDHGKLVYTDVRATDLDLSKRVYAEEQFESITLCLGYEGKAFEGCDFLPLNQTKGETLLISSQHLPTEESLNRKCFVLPLQQHEKGIPCFRVGATYEWHTSDLTLTATGRATNENNLAYLTKDPYTVLEQQAGIRPTTPDRRPLLLEHPKHSRVFIFNGLGTKGYMLSPLLSLEMSEQILG